MRKLFQGLRQKYDDFWDWLHERTCGSYSIVFRMARPFLVECPCCTFYRGVAIGFSLSLVVTGVIIEWLA